MSKVQPYHTVELEYPPKERNVYHDHDDCPDGRRIKTEHRRAGTAGASPLRRLHQEGVMIMTNRRPTATDRTVSHLLVGLLAGAVVGQKAGIAGFIVGGLAAALLHEALDAPVAKVVADLT